MPEVLNMSNLFDPELVKELFNRVRGKSSLAALCKKSPVSFVGNKVFTFSMDNEVALVAEGEARSHGGVTVAPVKIAPLEIEYGARVSARFMDAAEEEQLDILEAFNDGFSDKLARGIDIMAFHGLNPRTATAATATIGNNCFDKAVSNTVTYVAASANDNVDAAIALVEAAEHEVTGMAMAPAFRSALAAIKEGSTSNKPLFPELQWGASPNTLGGLSVDTNSTVSFTGTGTGNVNTDRAIVGNFRDFFKWGIAREIPIEIIEYGNPDNDANAGDLKGHNQIYIRGEVFVGWGILVPAAFAMIQA